MLYNVSNKIELLLFIISFYNASGEKIGWDFTLSAFYQQIQVWHYQKFIHLFIPVTRSNDENKMFLHT